MDLGISRLDVEKVMLGLIDAGRCLAVRHCFNQDLRTQTVKSQFNLRTLTREHCFAARDLTEANGQLAEHGASVAQVRRGEMQSKSNPVPRLSCLALKFRPT